MATMKIKDMNINYMQEDTGKPVLLFIHGYNSSIKILDALLAETRYYDVVALDLPGYGKSEINQYASIEMYAEVVSIFIEELGLKDVTLMGHSMGAGVAVFTDQKYIRQIILYNPLNPYMMESYKKSKSLADVLASLIDTSKDGSTKFARQLFNDYKENSRILIKDEIMNEKWLGNQLYLKYRGIARYTHGISVNDDKVIIKESIDKVEESFGIKFKRIPTGGHSKIRKEPEEINTILNMMLKY